MSIKDYAGCDRTSCGLEFHPLTADRWADFEGLFGDRGAYGGCWCMWWRSTRREFEEQQGEGNRQAMKALVESGEVPGILAYSQGRPVGWCSVAPRERYGSLERSPVLKRLDDRPVWSIVCFFVAKGYRDRGVGEALLRGAVEYVRKQGGEVVEAYPTQPRKDRLPPVSSFMGTPAMFERAGFVECARPSKSKVVMRYSEDIQMNLDLLSTQMADNARRIRSLIEGVSVEQARWKPNPKSWSLLEVINHLGDEEKEDFRVRLDIILHHPDRPWSPIDPEGWVVERQYNQRELEESLDSFLRAREESLEWLRGLSAPNWEAEYEAPFGRIMAGDVFASWVAHDLLHIRQLVELHWAYTGVLVNPYRVDYAGSWQ